MKEKVDFRHEQIWVWVQSWRKKLTSDMSKYNSSMILSMFIKVKVDFKPVPIWFWMYLSNEKLTLNMSNYDLEYVF
jgi:hypothetical protein